MQSRDSCIDPGLTVIAMSESKLFGPWGDTWMWSWQYICLWGRECGLGQIQTIDVKSTYKGLNETFIRPAVFPLAMFRTTLWGTIPRKCLMLCTSCFVIRFPSAFMWEILWWNTSLWRIHQETLGISTSATCRVKQDTANDVSFCWCS